MKLTSLISRPTHCGIGLFSPHVGVLTGALLLVGLLATCAPAAEPTMPSVLPTPIPTVTQAQEAAPTTSPTQTSRPPTIPPPTAEAPEETPLAASFPLSEPGPYYAGNRSATLVDQSRANREIQLVIWYPALKEKDAKGHLIRRNAAPDPSGAPYPVILTEVSSGSNIFFDHLATHGFVTLQITIPDHMAYEYWDLSMIAWSPIRQPVWKA